MFENHYQLLEKGRKCLRSNEYKEAEKAFSKAVKKKKDSANAWIGLSFSLIGQQRFQDAKDAYVKSKGLMESADSASIEMPFDAKIWLTLVAILRQEGLNDDAQMLENLAMQVLPHDAQGIRSIVGTFLDGGDYKGAEMFCRDLIKAKESAESYYWLCSSLSYQGRIDEAEQACRKTVELDDTHGPGWSYLVWMLFAQGRNEEADQAARHTRKLMAGNMNLIRNTEAMWEEAKRKYRESRP
jgi:Flp pilus assembly protein TadD